MNRPYELGFIIPSNIPETETQGVIDTVRGWIESLDGQVTNVDYWGRRRLAYSIEEFREGYYVFLHMDFAPSRLRELENNLHLSNQVIRHLVIRLDEK